MNRLCIATRGIGSWRERLADPDRQWERSFSAMETAVSWERASDSVSGLPESVASLFENCGYSEPILVLAIAEHKVPLVGQGGDSQCDVWALINTSAGALSLSVEAKAKESFGTDNESLAKWLLGNQYRRPERSRENRKSRWDYIKDHLPSSTEDGYSLVAYQLLHRCAAAVIEARRLRLQHAAFIVQAFESPAESFDAYSRLCQAMSITAERGRMQITTVGSVRLGVGWADCPLAGDSQLAGVR